MQSDIPPPLPVDQQEHAIVFVPASMGVRSLAFFMDLLLVITICTLLLTKLLLPHYHGEGLHEYSAFKEQFFNAVQLAAENGGTAPSLMAIYDNQLIVEMIAYIQTTTMLVCWCYFGLMEAFMGGTTLGKRTFSLRTVKLDTGLPGTFFDNVMRGASKSIMLTVAAPILWVNFFIPFMNKGRRSGHDYLSRSIVIAE